MFHHSVYQLCSIVKLTITSYVQARRLVQSCDYKFIAKLRASAESGVKNITHIVRPQRLVQSCDYKFIAKLRASAESGVKNITHIVRPQRVV